MPARVTATPGALEAIERLRAQHGPLACYIDSDQDERWHRPALVLDVHAGAAEGFSLEGLEGVHFVTSSNVAAR
jgi:uncharacterized protein (DUF779 family)